MSVIFQNQMDQVIGAMNVAGLDPVGQPTGSIVETPTGQVFVKIGSGGENTSQQMLEYEKVGLEHLSSCAPSGLILPKPLLVGELNNGNGFICLEYLDFLRPGKVCLRKLGTSLAQMHQSEPSLYEGRFGFPMDGCCGALAQPNNAEGRRINWVDFYREYRLEYQLQVCKSRHPSDMEIQEKGAQLSKRLDELFSGAGLIVEDIKPSILHGDLWAGNVGAVDDQPAMFDPAAYYGHAEADMGIAYMFGGFGREFFEMYHKIIPKTIGFDKRAKLYELHHHLNHYNIFGSSYRHGALTLMNDILQ